MASSRLNDSQKQDLVERYRAGESSSALAAAFGCSVNTVSRTVRNLLPPEAYEALKAARAKGLVLSPAPATAPDPDPAAPTPACSVVDDSVAAPEPDVDVAHCGEEETQSLSLDDADDFSDEDDEVAADDPSTPNELAEDLANQFHEVAILTGITHADSHVPVTTQPLAPGVLPESVYMLVDKVVELDPRPLSDFPEIGSVDPADLERQAISLFANPRAAKRQCGRNQRVIRVPDTAVFTQTSRYLLARGITRLVLEGSLIALDA